MKRNIFAVCDLEVDYALNFMDYMNRKKNIPFEIQAFTSVENLIAYGKQTHIELLLISGRAMCREVRDLDIGKIIILSEGVHPPELDQYPSVYKYQSSSDVLREVMACYGAEKKTVADQIAVLKKTTEIIGIFSPLGRCLKTSFALTLGQILAKERAVLYLNMEEYSGFEELMGKGFAHNLSDLLYYVRQDNQNLLYKMNSMIQTINNLDYVPPVQMPADIRTTAWQDWERLFQMLILDSSYEVIVLDIGCGIDENFQLLDMCKKIYMPVLSDAVSQCKIAQFENLVRIWDYPQILEKTEKINPPFHMATCLSPAYVEQLMWSELGDYVREILRKLKKFRKDAVKGKRMNKDVFRKLRQMLMEELDLSRELSDKEILDVIDELILNQIKDVRLALKEKVQLRQELFYSVRKLDVLQELVDDETVTEIMVNGPDTIFVERAGKLMKWHKSFTSAEKLEDVIQQIVGKCNRVINESMPIVDARLENGSRVNAVIYPVALNGPILTIRRFPEHPITMEKLIALGSITQECAEFLEKLVKARYSMVIGGGTGSGKTTFLAAMSEYIPRDERLITIEDNAELRIRGIDNLVRLEAKMANMEGAVSVTIRDLIKSALRMRPDRIIVGEVRGGEAMDMLQALNTGHEGSLSTAHANSARDMLSRLETMVLMGVDLPLEAIRRQIASGVDILVHLGRMRDKSRKLLEVTEVCGFENGEIRIRPLYQWQEGKGLVKTASLLHVEKLERAGIEL